MSPNTHTHTSPRVSPENNRTHLRVSTRLNNFCSTNPLPIPIQTDARTHSPNFQPMDAHTKIHQHTCLSLSLFNTHAMYTQFALIPKMLWCQSRSKPPTTQPRRQPDCADLKLNCVSPPRNARNTPPAYSKQKDSTLCCLNE